MAVDTVIGIAKVLDFRIEQRVMYIAWFVSELAGLFTRYNDFCPDMFLNRYSATDAGDKLDVDTEFWIGNWKVAGRVPDRKVSDTYLVIRVAEKQDLKPLMGLFPDGGGEITREGVVLWFVHERGVGRPAILVAQDGADDYPTEEEMAYWLATA